MTPRWRMGLAIVAFSSAMASDLPSPAVERIFPLGGRRGTTVPVEVLGKFLSNTKVVEFDCRDLIWTSTGAAGSGKLSGSILISPGAALGPHIAHAVTSEGDSNSFLFNVGQFPNVLEAEPNDSAGLAQEIRTHPVEIQGRMDGSADIDFYAINARLGERLTFDLRSIEYGSALEAKMLLLDSDGRRVASNDDRNDFDETPFLEYTFSKSGRYYIQLDQYRGPRGFHFGRNCGYILRISELPVLNYVAPLGARVGRTTKVKMAGTALDTVERVELTERRAGEYSRMTYPYTIPIHFEADSPTAGQAHRIQGRILSRRPNLIQIEFRIPSGARAGLWQVWALGLKGVADGPTVELSDMEEFDEVAAARNEHWTAAAAVSGALSHPGEEDVYPVQALKGEHLHFWTMAAQMGSAHLDTVLELRDGSGKVLAESDDVVAGQGTLLGNPDSSLFFTPRQDGRFFLAIKDRLERGGPDFQYRLKFDHASPSFQLFTTPEHYTVARGFTAEIEVHLIREAGFDEGVSVWFEGMPPGVEAPRGSFRSDQKFEPNSDGADMIIPVIAFRIKVPQSIAPGNYKIRVLGAAASGQAESSRQIVEAHTTLLQGPLSEPWTYVRRPLPRISLTVVEPFDARISIAAKNVVLSRGDSAKIEFKTEGIPPNTLFDLKNLPPGVSYSVIERQPDHVAIELKASPATIPGSFEISLECRVENRWAASAPLPLSIVEAAKPARASSSI